MRGPKEFSGCVNGPSDNSLHARRESSEREGRSGGLVVKERERTGNRSPDPT